MFLDDLRRDGSAHEGCQRGCLLFWNTAWLKPKAENGKSEAGGAEIDGPSGNWQCGCCKARATTPSHELSSLSASTAASLSALPTTKGDKFTCQSTELAAATSQLRLGRWRCLLRDLRIGEITLARLAYILWRAAVNRLWRRLHGQAYYHATGQEKQTLTTELDLQPGEWVEVKSAAEIEATLDTDGRNRGLVFDPEMLLCCGHRYRVAAPLRKIIVEETGKMVSLSSTVLLEGTACQGICALNCPRANYSDCARSG